MNDGDNQLHLRNLFNGLVPFQANAVITPEEFNIRMRRLDEWKTMIQCAEDQNKEAVVRYLNAAEKQRLEAEVEQGRLAQQRLIHLNGGNAPGTLAAAAPSEGSFTGASYQQAIAPAAYTEIPSTARIVEVPTGTQNSPQPDAAPASSSSSFHPPHSATGMHPPQSYHPPTSYGPSVQSYYRATTSSSTPSSYSVPSNGTTTHQQEHRPSSWAQQPGQTGHYRASGSASHRSFSGWSSASTPGHYQGAYQSNYGASTSTSSSTSTGAASYEQLAQQHHRAAANRHTNSSMPPPAVPRQAPQAHKNILPQFEQQLSIWLNRILKSHGSGLVSQILAQILIMVHRKQKGTMMPADQVNDMKLNQNFLQACDTLSSQVQECRYEDIRAMLVRLWESMKLGNEGSQNDRQNFSSQPARPQPAASTPAAQATTVASHASETIEPNPIPKTHPTAPSSVASTSSQVPPNPQASISQVTTQSVAAPPAQTASTSVKATELSAGPGGTQPAQAAPIEWYTPRDPNAPTAFRDANGQLKFMSGARVVSTSVNPPAAVSPKPTAAQQTRSEAPPIPQSLPESSWSPEKAVRSTLAQDIMRSLGRPQGVLDAPLGVSSSSPEPDIVTGKRPHNHSSRSATPNKRPRLENDEDNMKEEEVSSLPGLHTDVTVEVQSQGTQLTAPLDVSPRQQEAEPQILHDVGSGSGHRQEPAAVHETGVASPGRAQGISSPGSPDADEVQGSVVVSAPGPSSSPSPSRETYGDDWSFVDAAVQDVMQLHLSQPQPKEKLPLFLPSPSNTPRSRRTDRRSPSNDSDTLSHPPRHLYSHKGKGKGQQTKAYSVRTSDDDEQEDRPRHPLVPPHRAYVLVPRRPRYATPPTVERRLSEPSDDEMARWSGEDVATNEGQQEENDVKAAVDLSYSRLHETPCQWSGCTAVLNSIAALQKHLVLHAGDKEDWGSYACQWQSCLSNRFVDKAGLIRHLAKHGTSPLHCPYEGCEQTVDTPDKLLMHIRSNKHRDDSLRKSWVPEPPQLPKLQQLPDVVPAYMSVPCQVRMHPMSKERHQWLGPKILENVTCFKWSGRRSNAGIVSRGSRRLAEKIANEGFAARLAGKSPADALEQIKRWKDDQYLTIGDGYDASRRYNLRCDDLNSGEVTQMVNEGLVLFAGDLVNTGIITAQPSPYDSISSAGPSPSLPAPSPEGADNMEESIAPDIRPSTTTSTGREHATPRNSPRQEPSIDGNNTEAGAEPPGGSVVTDRVDSAAEDVQDPGQDAGGGRLELPRQSNVSASARLGGENTGGHEMELEGSGPGGTSRTRAVWPLPPGRE